MTIPDLIHTVLRDIRLRFYGDRTMEYCRDKQALLKAIARYGYACDSRGWDLQPEYIARDIIALLKQIQTQGGPKGYLPVYLEGAVDRHVRLRAEEIQAEAAALDGRVTRTMAGVRVGHGPVENTTATLATIYRQLNARPRRTKTRKPRDQQIEFL